MHVRILLFVCVICVCVCVCVSMNIFSDLIRILIKSYILVLIKFYSILIQNLKQELLKNSPYNKMEQNFDCHPSDKIVCYNYFFSKNELCFFLELHPP